MALLALTVMASQPLIGAAAGAGMSADQEKALYLQRVATTGPNGMETYDIMEPLVGAADARPLPTASHPEVSQAALDAAAAYALANKSKALLIWRDGRLERAVYGPGADAATLINSGSMAKPLGAVAVGRAIELGAVKSLDEPVVDFITEWRGTPKAAITVRELLNMTAGLESQGAVKDPESIFTRAYLSPHHEQVMINDYPLTAAPGVRYQYSNTSADLIAVIIERATKRRYAAFVSDEVLKPLGAAGGQVWVDRPGGLAHSGCCTLLPAETWLRLGLLVMNEGTWRGRRLLPAGYAAAMRTPSLGNPRYGLGVWIEGDYTPRRGFGGPDQTAGAVLHSAPYLAKDLFLFDGKADQVLYMVPSQKLAILRMGDQPPKTPEWDNAFLPNLILKDLAGSSATAG